ncbi:MAG: HAMP domain-containing histidine kinase [Oscillospiraceae bacterium]|nr:HAMP domain-containing histidine kinase [Oscillospiraceae bacterium]
MRQYLRTVPGKTISFILFVLSVAAAVLCVLGAIIMWEANIYTTPKAVLLEDTLESVVYDIEAPILSAARARYNGAPVLWPNKGSNFRFILTDPEGKTIAMSEGITGNETWTYTHTYGVGFGEWNEEYYYGSPSDEENVAFVFRSYIDSSLKAGDAFALMGRLIGALYALRIAVYPLGLLMLILAVVCYVTLLCVSGRRPEDEELHPGPLYAVPFDLILAAVIILALLVIWFIIDHAINFSHPSLTAAVIAASLFLGLNVFGGLSMSASARIKGRTLLTNTVIWRLLKLLWRILCFLGRLLKRLLRFLLSLLRGVPLIFRTLLAYLALCFINLLVIGTNLHDPDLCFAFLIIELILLFILVAYIALTLRRLQKGAQALAAGDLDHQVDTKGMLWDFRRHGEDLNRIGEGMNAAVEERLRSERLKTELITNVSHDIKTPLTSIINYSDLIAKEPCENEKITSYAQVLTRQSARLKRLIDDLIEASKASAGSLDVVPEPCSAGVFITQAAAEYGDRLKKAELELITQLPEKPVAIMADGRRLWRVFDNLLGNICKYAQPGTRVYLSLEEREGSAVITFKNVSRSALNVSPEELLDRFVRGDASRHEEGNGLGLSIARSLTELQNGTLELAIDGDLFKAILRFPVIG